MDKRSEMDPLLVSYLLRETSPEEDIRVREWIGSDEQNRLYFEALSRSWRSTTGQPTGTTTDIDGEWGHFQDLLATRRKRKTVIRKMVLTTAVAASLLTVILWPASLSKSRRPEAKGLAATKTTKQEALWQKLVNTSDKDSVFNLPDGSTIFLSPNSELAYRLTPASRELALNGKATFTAAKDEARPFSVFSGDIVTTALGTTFSISAFPGESSITIRLHEGKVVVRSVDSIRNKLAKVFYLVPGNELVYDKHRVTARLGRFGTNVAVRTKKNPAQDQPVTDSLSIDPNEMGSWYMFNNQSLDQIFDQLQEMFGTKIIYPKTAVMNKYFIGKFDKSDSLINILRKITLLNELKLTKKDNMFIISK